MHKLRFFVLASALTATGGCSLIVAPDEDLLKQGGSDQGGAGATGGGGATGGEGGLGGQPGGGGQGGLGGTGGTGGEGGGNPCAEQCPGTDTDCRVRSCDENDVCGFTDLPMGTACDEDGGFACDGAGACIECFDSTDCLDPAEPLCVLGACEPTHCGNSAFDPADGETDVDCGGECAGCANGLNCTTFADCQSAFCDAGSGDCAPCADDTDCQTGSYCDPNEECVPKLPDGDACTAGNECESDSCVDDVCCDSLCDGTCEACNVIGSEGACTAFVADSDPDNECGADVCDGASECRCSNGVDDGLETDIDCGGGVCGTCAVGDSCGGPSDCTSDTCVNNVCVAPGCGDGFVSGTDQCDGNGTGTPGETSTCDDDCTFRVCGDSNVNTTGLEACDDGDATGGDGCGATCLVEAGYSCTGEPSVCTPICGDGVVTGSEQCDQGGGNVANGDGCSSTCQTETGFACSGTPSVCAPVCGNGLINGSEQCDQGGGNVTNGDGCSSTCQTEGGFTCSGLPSSCTTTCGDGVIAGSEQCDQGGGNVANGDGCSSTCQTEGGFTCSGLPSSCTTTCGDGVIAGTEQCDQGGGNVANGDGCSSTCQTEGGFTCSGLPSSCTTTCGDGVIAGTEQCDQGGGNVANGDGCSSTCQTEGGFTCSGLPSSCTTTCGDGVIAGTEQCDQGGGNVANGDGCSSVCAIEAGFTCSGLPSVCSATCGNGTLDGGEGCDDGDNTSGDGCSAACVVEAGFTCSGAPSTCVCDEGFFGATCSACPGGSGAAQCSSNGTCDDGLLGTGACTCADGFFGAACASTCPGGSGAAQCSSNGTCDDGAAGSGTCTCDAGYSGADCATTTCGDGVTAGSEQCDDNNTASGDGCSSLCVTEFCGDGITNDSVEECDDADADDLDGCTAQCVTATVCDATALPGADRFSVDAFTGTCYASYDDDTTDFGGAYAACVAAGGHLVTITSAAESALVADVHNTAQNPWIGASDDANDTDAVFDWVTNEAWGFTEYAAGEPDDDVGVGGNGECLHLVNAAGEWADTNCNFVGFVTGRICELPVDTCGDGIVQAVNGEQCDDGNSVVGDGCDATCSTETLFFSEYIEGSSNNKAVEIRNPSSSSSFDLAANNCSVRLYTNGAAAPSQTVALTQTIAANDVLVVCHASSSAAILALCDVQSTATMNFNGDDTVELFCNGATVDVIGQIGVDPGTAWGTAPETTVNQTLQRRCGIGSGDTNGGDVFTPATEFAGFAIDTITDLGLPGCAP
ncbi:MAG: DUF4215 domain-containing protein [Polyangiaceae bacterium]|nr:DUF4215 domain-containing protein [Polyangiaceae bacterium]